MNRLDKILATSLNISRKDAKALLKQGRVFVDGKKAVSGDIKCDDDTKIEVDGTALTYNEFVYIMLNKPKGVVSASKGKGEKTVVDLLPDEMKRKDLFPAGRLDKDTTGFILITDDGQFAHDILSPSHHIDKTYIATLDKTFTDELVEDFENGMMLNDQKLISAQISAENDEHTVARVVLRQGLYHQVKRMFLKHGITVVELKRIKMGDLSLDESLKEGECRYITKDELAMLMQK